MYFWLSSHSFSLNLLSSFPLSRFFIYLPCVYAQAHVSHSASVRVRKQFAVSLCPLPVLCVPRIKYGAIRPGCALHLLSHGTDPPSLFPCYLILQIIGCENSVDTRHLITLYHLCPLNLEFRNINPGETVTSSHLPLKFSKPLSLSVRTLEKAQHSTRWSQPKAPKHQGGWRNAGKVISKYTCHWLFHSTLAAQNSCP